MHVTAQKVGIRLQDEGARAGSRVVAISMSHQSEQLWMMRDMKFQMKATAMMRVAMNVIAGERPPVAIVAENPLIRSAIEAIATVTKS